MTPRQMRPDRSGHEVGSGSNPHLCMNSPAASTSALSPVENHDTDRISAYYSLAFPNFTYYLQTPTVTIGRRPIPSSSASSSDLPLIDVDLGPLKSVSRLHARIEYEEEEEIFVLVVLGRNGAWVDGIWAPSGSRVPLGARFDARHSVWFLYLISLKGHRFR